MHILAARGRLLQKLNYFFSDAGVLRRLSFTAEYDVKCDLTSGEIAQSTLASMALSNVHQLKQICGNGKISFVTENLHAETCYGTRI